MTHNNYGKYSKLNKTLSNLSRPNRRNDDRRWYDSHCNSTGGAGRNWIPYNNNTRFAYISAAESLLRCTYLSVAANVTFLLWFLSKLSRWPKFSTGVAF